MYDHQYRVEVLRELAEGPIPVDDLLDHFVIGHPDDQADWLELLEEDDRTVLLSEDRLGDVVQLVEHAWVTIRLDEQAITANRVAPGPFLGWLVDLAGSSIPLHDGGRVGVHIADDDLTGQTFELEPPPGLLADAGPGDLLGLRLRDGLLDLRVGIEPTHPDPDDLTDTLEEIARAVKGTDQAVDASRVLLEALAERPDLLAEPALPPEELLAARGWACDERRLSDDPSVVADGMTLGRVILLAGLAMEHRLESAWLERFGALLDLRGVCHRGEAPAPDVLAQAAEALRDAITMDVFVSRTTADAPAVAAARLVLEADPDSPGAHFVLARAAEVDGDLEAMAAHLRTAAEELPASPATADLGWLARDRGELQEALRLWRRAGGTDDPEAKALMAHLRRQRQGPSRNAPCPCGSGRKFKQCCGAREGGWLAQRAPLLVDKAIGYLMRPHRAARYVDLVRHRLGTDEPTWYDVDEDLLVIDLALFRDGVFAEFLDRHGPLLPDDERELASRWLDSELRVWRVLGAKGERLRMHADGQEVEVVARNVHGIDPGTEVLARVVDGAGDLILFDGLLELPTGSGERVATVLADPDRSPAEVCQALSAHPLQGLVDHEGDPLCLGVAWLDHDDVVKAIGALGQAEDMDGGVTRVVWLADPDVRGRAGVNGTVWVGEDTDEPPLRVEATSEPRLDALIARVEAVGGTLVRRRTTPYWQAMDDVERFGPAHDIPLEDDGDDPLDEDLAAHMDDMVQQMEIEWCDTEVPALGGLTPREALDHPVARADLLKLLDSLDDEEGTFDAGRLRAELGLTS